MRPGDPGDRSARRHGRRCRSASTPPRPPSPTRRSRAGATIVNDVSAGTADPEMLDVVAAAGAGYVAMHMQGEPRTMQAHPHYDDVVGEVAAFLVGRLDAARAAGVADDALMADPGHRVRQDARAQPRAARVAARADRRGRGAGAGGDVAEGVPRSHHRRGRSGGARRRDAGDGGVGARTGRGDGACARRPGRGAGGGGAGSDGACLGGAPRDGGDTMTTLRGRWAQGLEPRMFCWIIKDRLAASERPGGFARNHRKIRRQEELIWLAQQGFTRVVSLLDSPHNLHAYGEAGIACEHVPLGRHDELTDRLPADLRVAGAAAGLAAGADPAAPRGVRRPAHRRARRLPDLRGTRRRGPARDAAHRATHEP